MPDQDEYEVTKGDIIDVTVRGRIEEFFEGVAGMWITVVNNEGEHFDFNIHSRSVDVEFVERPVTWTKGDMIGRMHPSGDYYADLYTYTGYGYWQDPNGDFLSTESVAGWLSRGGEVIRQAVK